MPTARNVPIAARLDDLASRYGAVFLDAYGVLVNGDGAIAGARDAIARLERNGRPWFVMTNDASRLRTSMSAHFEALGLAIPTARIVAACDALPGFFATRGLRDARTVTLGPADSHALVHDAGARLIDPMRDLDFDVLVVCDQTGYPMLETIDRVVSGLLRAIDRGRTPTLILPNPDRVYPKRDGEFGLAAGSIAAMIEAALGVRTRGDRSYRFESLGKPHAPIFEEACRRANTRDAVLLGDQLLTDVRGANAFGIASAIVGTGVTQLDEIAGQPDQPTYVLEDLRA